LCVLVRLGATRKLLKKMRRRMMQPPHGDER
jgi:hypothetical protein